MIASAMDQDTLGWDDLVPLHRLLSDAEPRIRAAAAEAVVRLPLSESAWARASDALAELLEESPSVAIARAAAHTPLIRLRQQLRTIAADGGHPGQHAASTALAEVGDDSVLVAEVSRLLGRPLTERSAVRLAGLPVERLSISSQRIPDWPASEGHGSRSLWTSIAAARLGQTDRLDRVLRRAADDAAVLLLRRAGQSPGALLSASVALRAALRSVLPLPEELLAHLDRQLSAEAEAHRVLRSLWLPPRSRPLPPRRLDDFTDPLARFVNGVRNESVMVAGFLLAAEATRFADRAPDPRAVFATWLRVAESATAAWPQVAWTLGAAGGRRLVDRLSPWLRDSDSAVVACVAVRDAAGWLRTPQPPDEPSVVIAAERQLAAGVAFGRHPLPPPEQPPWPRPTELMDMPSDGDAPLKEGWAAEVPSFGADFEPEGIVVPTAPTPGAPPSPEPSPTVGAAPPAPAYAKLSCPSAVVVDEEFGLELGLAPRPTRGVTAQPLVLPERAAYTLTVQIVVDGFTLRVGERPTIELAVTPATPYPTGMLHLTAESDPELGALRSILAVFSVDGHPIGSATRAVEVVPTGADLPAHPAVTPAAGIDTALPVPAQTADLTITIAKGDDIEGRRLLWSYQSPHPSVPGAEEPLVSTLGSRPDEFARTMLRTAGRSTGESLARLIAGKARRIAEAMPAEVHAALHATAAAVGDPPTVLIVSADPYIPWELTRVDPPWIADAPAVLGAQAIVGRWALRAAGPTPDPPRSVAMRAMNVVRGIYQGVVGFKRLEHAEQEAGDLQQTYGATVVDAREETFYACLDGEPPAEVLHFAMHGKFDPTGLQDGLILVDGVVEPDMILGADLAAHPFVFLNACQVGQAGETLGQYGGMAQSFVEAGASAVIAPLWVVQDDVAREVSLRFYASAFDGVTPAEFLRTERARDGSGTHLAYVLYGHPLLQLTRSKEADGDADPVGP